MSAPAGALGQGIPLKAAIPAPARMTWVCPASVAKGLGTRPGMDMKAVSWSLGAPQGGIQGLLML